MKTELTKLDKVKKVLGREIALATETLGEGKVTIEAEVFAEGEAVMIISAEGEEVNEPLPVNEEGYTLDNGMILVVKEEGVIFSIGEKAEESEEEEEVAASDKKTETPLPKAVIESIVKETKFSKEQIIEAVNGLEAEAKDPKDLEITELKAKIEELEKVDEPTDEEIKLAKEKEEADAVELAKKGAKHNPEEKATAKKKKLDTRNMSASQIMMSKMANL